jgi:hypothetical protein
MKIYWCNTGHASTDQRCVETHDLLKHIAKVHKSQTHLRSLLRNGRTWNTATQIQVERWKKLFKNQSIGQKLGLGVDRDHETQQLAKTIVQKK